MIIVVDSSGEHEHVSVLDNGPRLDIDVGDKCVWNYDGVLFPRTSPLTTQHKQ